MSGELPPVRLEPEPGLPILLACWAVLSRVNEAVARADRYDTRSLQVARRARGCVADMCKLRWSFKASDVHLFSFFLRCPCHDRTSALDRSRTRNVASLDFI